MPTGFQRELTDGTHIFIHDASDQRHWEHTDARYHIPGGTTRARWQLLKQFPALRDTKRRVEVPSMGGRPAGPRVDLEGRARAIELSEAGIALVEIARRVDRTPQTIRKWLKGMA